MSVKEESEKVGLKLNIGCPVCSVMAKYLWPQPSSSVHGISLLRILDRLSFHIIGKSKQLYSGKKKKTNKQQQQQKHTVPISSLQGK